MEAVAFVALIYWLCLLSTASSSSSAATYTSEIPFGHRLGGFYATGGSDQLLHASFPSEADTLAYVDALKHSNFSQWRSLEEVAKRAGGGSCSGAVNTSVLTALYLLGLFNLCAASPASCCVPPSTDRRRRRSSLTEQKADSEFPRLLDSLKLNLSSISLEQFNALPHVSTPDGGKIPVHISVVEQVRKLWDSNPRLLSSVKCSTATEAVRSSFISLSGVASGIILAYSIAQLNQCYPDHQQGEHEHNIWFFPIPRQSGMPSQQKVRSLPPEMPVKGEDDPSDGCDRTAVRMENGECAQVFSSDVCPYISWVLLNRETGKGECVPRLCSNGKVFVEHDQMCHDVHEEGFCPQGQRLYLTAWGEAVCDCIDGMFYGPDGNCHRLYEQAYCYKGTVLQFHKPSKTLVCKADSCQHLNNKLLQNDLPYAKAEDGSCYQFSSIGPCEIGHRFGFDIEDLKPTCVSLEQAGIIRPPKSYQYSHMSFPSSTDVNVPHYEVSYVILNGSTWELMMRTVGREKRDTRDSDRKAIPFLDTRNFPTRIEEILPGLEELGLMERIESNSGLENAENSLESTNNNLQNKKPTNPVEPVVSSTHDESTIKLTYKHQNATITDSGKNNGQKQGKKKIHSKIKNKNKLRNHPITKNGKRNLKTNYDKKKNRKSKSKIQKQKAKIKKDKHESAKLIPGNLGFGENRSIETLLTNENQTEVGKEMTTIANVDNPKTIDENNTIAARNGKENTFVSTNQSSRNFNQSKIFPTGDETNSEMKELRKHENGNTADYYSKENAEKMIQTLFNIAKSSANNTILNLNKDIENKEKPLEISQKPAMEIKYTGHELPEILVNDLIYNTTDPTKENETITEEYNGGTFLNLQNRTLDGNIKVTWADLFREIRGNASQFYVCKHTYKNGSVSTELRNISHVGQENRIIFDHNGFNLNNSLYNLNESTPNKQYNNQSNLKQAANDNLVFLTKESLNENNQNTITNSNNFNFETTLVPMKSFNDSYLTDESDTGTLYPRGSKNLEDHLIVFERNITNANENTNQIPSGGGNVSEYAMTHRKDTSSFTIEHVKESTTNLNQQSLHLHEIAIDRTNGDEVEASRTYTGTDPKSSNTSELYDRNIKMENNNIGHDLKDNNSSNKMVNHNSDNVEISTQNENQGLLTKEKIVNNKSLNVPLNKSDHIVSNEASDLITDINLTFPYIAKPYSNIENKPVVPEEERILSLSDNKNSTELKDITFSLITNCSASNNDKNCNASETNLNALQSNLEGTQTLSELLPNKTQDLNVSRPLEIEYVNRSRTMKSYFDENLYDRKVGGARENQDGIQLLVEQRLKQISEEDNTKTDTLERDLHKVEGIIQVLQTGGKILPKKPSLIHSNNSSISHIKTKSDSANKQTEGHRKVKKEKRGRNGTRGRSRKRPDKRRKNEVLQVTREEATKETSQVEYSEKNKISAGSNFTTKLDDKSVSKANVDEDSLPDYLRNRDRRQAGIKRVGKTSPGIINAPLLNQCRPGAKRDYNGHCRPKVIPEDDVPAPRRPKDYSYQPTLPRIKCEGTTRLDARGICRTTFSGLG